MKTHTDLINLIADKIGAKQYIEIGVYNPAHNFDLIKVHSKISVDPDPGAGAQAIMTSDRFFEIAKNMSAKTDLVFIDGLHHADQVKKDIENAWNILRPGGVIILHDCNPPTEKTTCIPRGSQREWCGDVYKTICQISSPGFFTADFDYGCTVIRKGDEPLQFLDIDVDWEKFDRGRHTFLNLVSVERAKEIIEEWT